jgi:5-methylcytosine-specific restriction endonuclease McrA
MSDRRSLYDAYEGVFFRNKAQAEYNRSLPYGEFLHSLYWKYVRRVVFRAWGRRGCARCHNKNAQLDIHHKTYAHRGDELNHLEDLIVICDDCHTNFHDLATVDSAAATAALEPASAILKRIIQKQGGVR